MEILIGLAFIGAGLAILARSWRRKPDIIGRNEAVRRLLEMERDREAAQG
jgi:hypothetical protein